MIRHAPLLQLLLVSPIYLQNVRRDEGIAVVEWCRKWRSCVG